MEKQTNREKQLGNKSIYLEICANSVVSAVAAQEGGASRIELCQQLEVGGVTPSPGQILLAREKLDIGIHVLIRPRAGDFVYSSLEIEEIMQDIVFCKTAGCEGVVIGALHPDGTVDAEATRAMVALASPMKVTFHRAFDRSRDPFEALETIIACGCHRVLTSGQESNAHLGRAVLTRLVQAAAGRIEIMPGAGVTEANMLEILRETGASCIHSSAKVDDRQSLWLSSKEKVRTMADLLENF